MFTDLQVKEPWNLFRLMIGTNFFVGFCCASASSEWQQSVNPERKMRLRQWQQWAEAVWELCLFFHFCAAQHNWR